MQQHERPPDAYAHPSRRPRPRLALPTGPAATLPAATGARSVSPSASGVPTTGCPNFGADVAG